MSIFPFIDPQVILEQREDKPLSPFSEYAFDIEKNVFLLQNGRQYLVYENEALKIWVYKALLTPRYRHLAFTKAYGSELADLFGKVTDRGVLQSEVKRCIIESLMVNPYILELRDFQFWENRDCLNVSFECITVYGALKYSHPLKRM